VFPVSRALQRFNDIGAMSHVTSANSATPYRDELFGPDFAHSIFISEPVYNLVHREILEPDGVSFTSHRAANEKETEFVASADNWFRPTMTKTGPDGALYIADMYRLVIEHPEWIPDDVKNTLDLRAGHDKGRIYRVYPANAHLREIPRLDKLDTGGLVAALDSSNGWQRDTAQRLLVERGDKKADARLQKLARGSDRPVTRMQALCALDGLSLVTADILKSALADSSAAVREQVLRLSEPLLRVARGGDGSSTQPVVPKSQLADLENAIVTLVNDPEIRVRYQLAFTLGEWDDQRAAEALVKIALKDSKNAEIQTAVMSSASRHVGAMLAMVLANPQKSGALLDKLLGLAASLGDEHSLAQAIVIIGKPTSGAFAAWQYSALGGVLDVLGRRGESLAKLQSSAGPELRDKIRQTEGLFSEARRMAGLPTPDPGNYPALIPTFRILGRGLSDRERDLELLAGFLQAQFPIEVQRAALAGLRRSNGKQTGGLLVTGWKGSSPGLRPELLNALFTRQEWVQEMLAGLEDGRITPNQIGAAEQQKLRSHKDKAIRERASKLFTAANSDRQKVVESYRGVTSLSGDKARGEVLFKANCAICHQAVGGRPQVGPDLGPLADKPAETLLVAILDPNQAVEARYVNYTATMKDEREFSGIVATESANSITLRSPASEETILRADLSKLTSSGMSLMPEGFEEILSPQDVADVIAYLRQKSNP
jgi:putative heme-binding domain-containing protein